jgi:hypothetical protein
MSSLFSIPQPPSPLPLPSPMGGNGDRPPPRRRLEKRKNKRRRRQRLDGIHIHRGVIVTDTNFLFGTLLEEEDDFETRPVRRHDAIEAGLDYWIDEVDLLKERQRRIELKVRRKRGMSTIPGTRVVEGGIYMHRLRDEVVAPFKQNWIGLLSAGVIALSAIINKFPELMQIPIIPIPDL